MRITAILLLLSACALDAEPDLASTADDITGGTSVNPNPRPEIGEWNGCTATINDVVIDSYCNPVIL